MKPCSVAEENKEPVIPLPLKFVFGAFSGCIASSCVHPADLVKTRMQLHGVKAPNLSGWQVSKRIVKMKGIQGLYAGYSASIVRQVLYAGGRLGGFNTLLDVYKEKYGTTPSLRTKIIMGMASGVLGAAISMPAEVALIRMLADGRLPIEKRKNYKHVLNALSRIAHEEGRNALIKGFWPTVTRSIMLNGSQLSAYAEARERLLPSLHDGKLLHFTSSMIAGFIATFVTLPLDYVKTRIQNSSKNLSQLGVLMHTVKAHGILRLWNGFIPSYLKIAPHTVITFMVLEQINHSYANRYG